MMILKTIKCMRFITLAILPFTLVSSNFCCKNPKNSYTQKNAAILQKFEEIVLPWSNVPIMKKGMWNSVNPDQTAHGVIWSRSTLFAYTCVSKNWRSLQYCATTWHNQQNDCPASEDSDQPGHPPSLIRDFTVCMKKPWALSYPVRAQRCPGCPD